MTEVIDAFHEWLRVGGVSATSYGKRDDLPRYFHAIAKAPYVIRKVVRIVDDQAKAAGLDPWSTKT